MEFMHAMWEVKVNTALITIALDPNQSDLMKTFTKNFIGSDKGEQFVYTIKWRSALNHTLAAAIAKGPNQP